jgi:formate hydrogenlyase transcriptional activator
LFRVLQEQSSNGLGSTHSRRRQVAGATNATSSRWWLTRSFAATLLPPERVPDRESSARERREDIAALVHYSWRSSLAFNKRIDSIPTSTMEALSRYDWPGNIRELENFMERAVILTRGSTPDAR